MISEAVVEAIKGYTKEENIHLQEPMSSHTTFRVGGPADCLVEICEKEELKKICRYLSLTGMPFFIMGNGSNLLVSDAGFRGVILKVQTGLSEIRVEGKRIYAQAGATMAQVARVAMEHGLAGLEFASGIPGTVGGGVVMNAGAYDGEMKQVVRNVEVLSSEGELMNLDNATMEFGYRTSSIKGKPFVVTGVEFELQEGDRDQIKAIMDGLAAKRREKQPLEYPSAGSTFKRPEGNFAGKLIMDAGLRGYTIGGAQVSEKHCGFLINTQPGVTTASDIMTLIKYVQTVVKDKFDVDLEPEVIFLGDF
ncbi:MAG: UDP-N-acetylmuramate dehydrogenase [Lachnospiraceae bacterium]|nr:UDP-N-acetylmuramate dehydrogenase [Lachnospiraceae bacterium]